MAVAVAEIHHQETKRIGQRKVGGTEDGGQSTVLADLMDLKGIWGGAEDSEREMKRGI